MRRPFATRARGLHRVLSHAVILVLAVIQTDQQPSLGRQIRVAIVVTLVMSSGIAHANPWLQGSSKPGPQAAIAHVKNKTPSTAPAKAKPPPAQAKPTPATPAPAVPVETPAPAPPVTAAPPVPVLPPEHVEVDVSTRTVAVTSVFSGTEIIVFGTVNNSRQVSAESGFYDVIVLVEGRGAPSIVRLKTNVGGLWINTQSVRFDNLPLYSAIASTRPIDEIAEPRVLALNAIGFGRARMFPAHRSSKVSNEELDNYKSAVIRLKQRDGLYVRYDYGVAFIGPALFRATIKLPVNIPIGPLDARVYLFREGQLLSTQTATVMLERQGLDRMVYDFAFDHPVWYGILTVAFAASAGFAASAVFRPQTG